MQTLSVLADITLWNHCIMYPTPVKGPAEAKKPTLKSYEVVGTMFYLGFLGFFSILSHREQLCVNSAKLT